MTKRRHVSLLPQYNQTADLSSFFDATVDQVFQPGAAEPISGYVGHLLSNTFSNDFYVGEPSIARSFYQLEPAMVSYDADDHSTINHALSYPDLVSYLNVEGALTDDHTRLFETDYYSWAPPINIDMLVNYRQYYWFGDVNLSASARYMFNGNDQSASLSLTNGNLSVASTADNINAAVRSVSIASGVWYLEFNIGPGAQSVGLANPSKAIDDTSGLRSSGNALVYGSDGSVYYNQPQALDQTLMPFTEGDVVGIAWNTASKKVWFRVNNSPWDNNVNDDPETNTGGFDITSMLATPPLCAFWSTADAGSRATINFGASAFLYSPPTGFIGPATTLPSLDQPLLVLTVPIATYSGDGSTVSFALPPPSSAVDPDEEAPAAFINNVPVGLTINNDGNSITLHSIPHAGDVVLVCRTPDLRAVITGKASVDVSTMNNDGVTWLSSTMRIRIIDCAHLSNAWDSRPWDTSLWDASDDAIYMVDGIGTSLRLTPRASMIDGLAAQYVTIDRSSIDANGWSLRNFWVHADAFAFSGLSFPARQATRPIIEFIRDIVRWPIQVWAENTDPLFRLYDLGGHRLDDSTVYPGSTFQGNRLFAFAAGVGRNDSVLRRPLAYDSNGYIQFSNDAFVQRYTYVPDAHSTTTQPIEGLVCYAVAADNNNSIDCRTLWQRAETSTVQTRHPNGLFEPPANLRCNPNYADVEMTSKATWSPHFASIMRNQLGFNGSVVGRNSYRDSPRDLSLGSHILQHTAPLLKTMLLAADADFDLPRAIRYSEAEYNRFRNKFLRKLFDLRDRGVLSEADDAETWLDTVLRALAIGHNIHFPFAYSNMGGGQYFIPATPTALGMWPATQPAIISDATYGSALRGHDGSLTPLFGDWRDQVMLALETRLYANVPQTPPIFDIRRWIGGCFFNPSKGYSWSETLAVLAPIFELWAQNRQLDFRSNTTFDFADPFTWNYRGVKDRFGNSLPGSWRAIYRFYYGTEAPHLRPWEMLGYTSEPVGWTMLYGSPPYTRSNTQLWQALAAGTGARDDSGTGMFIRPGLRDVIPVDDAGNLLDPIAIGIVLTQITPQMAARDWQAGDIGPAESLWWDSPSWRFAMARASYLMKPARFVEGCWDAATIGYADDQWVELDRLVRPLNAAQYVHGETNPRTGQIVHAIGLSQWIADYLVSNGRSSTTFGAAVRGLDVALMHQMAGFITGTPNLAADSFGRLPAEDVHVVLYASPALSTEVYSGVIIEWTGVSWKVLGYDGRDPSFTVIPPNTGGPRGLISLASAAEPAIVGWRPNTYYPVGILVALMNSVYECLRSHTSGAQFEADFWRPRADLATAMIQAPRVITYFNGLDTTVSVPYGTEFYSYQDVSDFLLGYERWLIARGWSFEALDPITGAILNWSVSVKEFLQWAQTQWAPGNFIAVSPGQGQLVFTAPFGTVLNVEDNITGFYGLTDRTGAPISQRDAIVSRLDNTLTLAARNADIFLARLELATVEHAIIPSNVTIFDDNVYLPLFDMRQERLLLQCGRSQGWAGRLEAPGFIINRDGTLSSSFERQANTIRLMYDIEQADADTLRTYSRHVIGMQERSYLNNLLLNDTEQFEFYQGMIQAKGSPGVFQALARSTLASNSSQLAFLEEWAIRIGDFGAPLDPFVTFQLSASDVRDDPQVVRFVQEAEAPLEWIQLAGDDARWVDKPRTYSAFFPEHYEFVEAAYPTAGPVRLSEVDNTAFSFTDVAQLYDGDTNTLPAGSLTWVYDSPPAAIGVSYYVNAATGDDNNNTGTSVDQPFASLQQAHDVSNPGDVINVADGTYTAYLGTAVLEISRSGTPGAPIVYQAMPGTRPSIVGTQSLAAVHFSGVSYVTLRGFDVVGWNDTLVLSDVQAALSAGDNLLPIYNGVGIGVDRGIGSAVPHHIAILDCVVHDFPYSGIQITWGDYITVRGCAAFSNAKYSPLSGAGISVLNSHGIDNQNTYKTFIQQNVAYNNINLVTNEVSGGIIDGSGISIIGNQNDSTDGVAYAGRTLIENNLCYSNGGNGVLVFASSHVDVIYNTTDHNQINTNYGFGEIVPFNAVDINVYNNIMVAASTAPISSAVSSVNVSYGNNLGYGGNGTPVPGVYGFSDPLFRNATNPARPDYRLRLGSTASDAADRRFTSEADLAGNARTPSTGYDLGCYQSDSAPPRERGRHPFDVLRSFDIGMLTDVVPNPLLLITTQFEDSTVTTCRISFRYPMTLTSEDVGNYLVIDGNTLSQPELAGCQIITAVHPWLNAVDIAAIGQKGTDFNNTPDAAPIARVLRSMRFDTLSAINPTYTYNPGDLIWLDHYAPQQWAVLQRQADNTWALHRLQPRRIDQQKLAETVIYRAGSNIVGNQMLLNRPVVPDVVVIDPLAGLICNVAARDIDFIVAADPARYNAGFTAFDGSTWGPNEIGRVWWDLSTVRFLDPYTDTLDTADAARDVAELQYRAIHWAQVAPNTSVDVYEWIESSLSPLQYVAQHGAGTVYRAEAPSWVERTVYSASLQSDITVYYFWVSGLTTVPNVSFRHTSVSEIALGIVNPSALDLPWTAAISPNALIVSGVAQALDETATVMKVRVQPSNDNNNDNQHHDQWALMRPGDATSQPSDALWDKLRDSLAAFSVVNTGLVNLPDPNLPPGRNTGISAGQNMFVVPERIIPLWQPNTVYYYGDEVVVSSTGYAYQCVASGLSAASAPGPSGFTSAILDNTVLWAYHGTDQSRGGLLAARRAFVEAVNALLAAVPMQFERPALGAALLRRKAFSINNLLAWAPVDDSYPFEPPPAAEWDEPWEVFSPTQRNDLLANPAFLDAMYAGTPISVLLNGIAAPIPHWSIWLFDPVAALRVVHASPNVSPSTSLLANADLVFRLKTAYDFQVTSVAERDALTGLTDGDRVLVAPNNPAPSYGDTTPFWAIYRASPVTIITPGSNISALDISGNTWTLSSSGVLQTNGVNAVNGTNVAALASVDGVIWKQDATSLAWATYTGAAFSVQLSGPPAFVFTLTRTQTYNTATFVEAADWYASGYTPSEPPIVSYPTVAARDANEGIISPTNRFVRVDDGGHGSFIWTAFLNGSWQTVAMGSGTIQLSSALYDPLRVVHAVSTASAPAPASLDTVAKRDGSWELRILVHVLRHSGLLLDSEINTLWFTMLNFCHVQQHEVDWAFKTSFLTLAGVAVPMNQTPSVTLDQTDNLIEYINEVKPYRVKVRGSTAQYSPPQDALQVAATDFDKPVYLDPSSGVYRVLDPDNPDDVAVLQTTAPWSDWYETYLSVPAPVRGINVSLTFDRLSSATLGNWDMQPWDSGPWDAGEIDGGAAYRILTQYVPSDGMPPVDVTYLLGLNERAAHLSGGNFNTAMIPPYLDTFNVGIQHQNAGRYGALSGMTSLAQSFYMPSVAGTAVSASLMLSADTPSDGGSVTLYLVADDGSGSDIGIAGRPLRRRSGAFLKACLISTIADSALPASNQIVTSFPIKVTITPAMIAAVQPFTEHNIYWIAVVLDAASSAALWCPDSNLGNGVANQAIYDNVNGTRAVSASVPPFEVLIVPNLVDGGTLIAENYAYGMNIDGYPLRSPETAAGHPEERVAVLADDGLQMIVTADALAGGPPQVVKVFDLLPTTAPVTNLYFDHVAQGAAGILVYVNGVRKQLNIDYVVDHLGSTVQLNNQMSVQQRVIVHAFGFGGASAVSETHYRSYGTSPLVLDAPTPHENVAVVINGALVAGSGYTVDGATVNLAAPPPAGSDVALAVFTGGATTASIVNTESFTYDGSTNVFTLTYPDTETQPEHGATIVELNGLRLTPPVTFYGSMTLTKQWMYLPIMPDITTTVTVYANGVVYTDPIPIVTGTNVSSSVRYNMDVAIPSAVWGRFVFFNNMLVALDAYFSADEIAVVMSFPGKTPGYTVTNGVLTVNTAMAVNDVVTVTTFTHATPMRIQTVTFNAADIESHVVPAPYAKSYAIVWMAGKRLAQDDEFTLPLQTISTNEESFVAPVMTVTSGKITGDVVATMFTGQAARESMRWMYTTTTGSAERMHPAKSDLTRLSIADRFEWLRLSEAMAGVLANDLAVADSAIVVNLFIGGLTRKMRDVTPLPMPDVQRNMPGVIWIGGERIEYFGFDRVNNTVTLSALRRATRGTSMGGTRLVQRAAGLGSEQLFIFNYDDGVVDVEIDGVPMRPDAYTVDVENGVTSVAVTARLNALVIVGFSTDITHFAGDEVYNGKLTFPQAIPLGPSVGNRELQPMHDIITGG
jgi:hypothetical protein